MAARNGADGNRHHSTQQGAQPFTINGKIERAAHAHISHGRAFSEAGLPGPDMRLGIACDDHAALPKLRNRIG